MSNIQKIVFIILICVIIIFLFIFLVRPIVVTNLNLISKISEEKKVYNTLRLELSELVSLKNKYYALNAEYQKISMQLPSDCDISVLTSEIYDFAKYAGIDIQSINFEKKNITEDSKKEEQKIGKMEIDMIVEGSYYQILNFLNTIEIMPRIIKINDIIIQSGTEDYENLLAYITAESYFYKKNVDNVKEK